jgi:predicted dienelactone hydrolase
MAAAGTWLYGERGLAAADRPALMIAATEDEFIPYSLETAFIFEHLGAPVKSLISFIGKDHMRTLDPDPAKRIKHFMTAFFGYQLQGREDYLEYFSQDFVNQFEDLAWGIYQK